MLDTQSVESFAPGRNATRSENWWLVVAGALLVAGVFSDGYAHSNFVEELESFLTPWHAVIFLGYLGCLLVVARAVQRRMRPGVPWRRALPAGWRSAVVGVGLFAAGFLGDGIWHTLYGIEADLEALLSPTHLLMLAGALAVLAAPATTRGPTLRASWREQGPVVAAVTLMMALASFFLVWVWPVNNGFPLGSCCGDLFETRQQLGVAAYLIFAALLAAPPLILNRDRALPPGAVVVIALVPWVGLNAAFMSFFAWQRLVPVAVAALAADVFLRRSPSTVFRLRVLGFAFPVLWAALDMVTLQLVWGLGWPPEFVVGSVVGAGFVGYAISVLAVGHPPTEAVAS